MRWRIITWKRQTRGAGAVPVLCRHATVFTATNEQQIGLSCHWLPLQQCSKTAGRAREPRNNSTTGVVSSSLNSQEKERKKEKNCLRRNVPFSKNNPRPLRLRKAFQEYPVLAALHMHVCACAPPPVTITSPVLSITLHRRPLPHRGSTISKAISW